MEGKGNKGSLGKVLIFVVVAWLIYDNVLAKHWTVNWNFKNVAAADSFLDSDSPRFRSKKECIAYAADLNSLAEALKYDCGYKCKYDSTDMLLGCKEY